MCESKYIWIYIIAYIIHNQSKTSCQIIPTDQQMCLIEEEFEDTKGVIGIRKSKKDRQHNGQMKKDERRNNDLQNIHIKHFSSYY